MTHGKVAFATASVALVLMRGPFEARGFPLVALDPTDFFSLAPCRVIDTRNPAGLLGGPALVAGGDRVFPLAGVCGIPSGATAVSVTIAVTGATAAGNLRLHAGGTLVPLVSAVNYSAGQTRSNNAVVPLSPTGELAAFVGAAAGTVHFILDVNGYFAPASSPTPETLTITRSGNGTGAIADNQLPAVLSCPTGNTNCTAIYDYNTSVTLAATAGTGSTFSGWSGATGCTGTSTCTVLMTAAQSVTATFTLQLESLTINTSGGNGTGTVQCAVNGGASGACAASFNYGSSVVITATPNVNSNFASWTGCDSTSTNTCTVSMTVNKAVTAAFTVQTFVVTLNKIGGAASGSITGGLTCGTTCNSITTTVNYGSNMTLTASPASGFIFTGWSGCSTTDGRLSCTLSNIIANASVGAPFGSSLCASTVTVGQSFWSAMQGCSGVVPFASSAGPNRASLCGAATHVCNANEWAQNNGGVLPTHNYWTDDPLNFSQNVGTCGPGSVCNGQNCFATLNGDTTYAGGCTANQPMHVCTATQPDPEGNTCAWTGCGFNSILPKMSFGGCSGGNDNRAGTACCSNALLHQFYVSPGTGNDINPGTSALPFKTIKKALTLAAFGDTIFVRPGLYTALNGETFPVTIPAGVNLIGDEPTRGSSTTISGQGTDPLNPGGPQPAVIANANSTIAGFTVTGNYGMVPSGSGVTIRNNKFTGSSNDGLHVDSTHGANGSLVVLNNVIGNPVGMVFAGVTAKLENNRVTGSGAAGVEVFGTATDLGGGALSSVGNNILSCNLLTDLLAAATGIPAANNQWDHASPTSFSGSLGSAGGADIYLNGGSSVTTSGARQNPTACACDATAISTQLFDGAMQGCGASGTPAAIAFSSRASLCPVGTHACTAAEWNLHRGATPPNSNYWTGDAPLNYVSGLTNSCSVSTISGSNACAGFGGAMLVCPNGGLCQLTGCGLDTTVNQFFGGCSTSSGVNAWNLAQGTLCCNP